ncbi:MAG: carboxypeptidase-like regulatory domain-containing protein, partial [Candidatus Baldrarchaeia archaeon]
MNHFFIDGNRRFDEFVNITKIKTYGYNTTNIKLKIGNITIYGKMKISYQPQILEQYENETITIYFNITDTFRKTPIENCNIILTINNHTWFITWSHQNYSCTLNLTGIEPGNHTINVVIKAPYYFPQTLEIPLHILRKTCVILTVNVPQEVTVNSIILISGTLTTESGEPIAMATIKVKIQVIYRNETEKQFEYETVTNTKGEFSCSIPTNNEISEVHITVVYEGTIDKTSAYSTHNITVKPFNPPLKSLLLHWLTTIILTMPFIFMGAFGYISKRKQKTKIEQEKLLREYELILELDSLETLLVVDKKSGRCLFEYNFKKIPTDPNIISGFVQAVRGFYAELGGIGEGEVGEIYYEMPEPKVLTFHSGKYIYPILIAPGKLLPEVKECLRNFLDKFEEEFKGLLEKGNTNITIYSL